MRIIGGTYRGKQITAPSDLPVRPTTDFAKTGLFNLLLNHFNPDEINALDLYSGTGSITYELLSRGCTEIHAVDRTRECVRFIRSTLEKLRAPSGVRVYQSDALDFLKNHNNTYKLIFADPPFELEIAAELRNCIREYGRLQEDGLLVIEHITGKDYSALDGFMETRKYGNVSFSFFEQ